MRILKQKQLKKQIIIFLYLSETAFKLSVLSLLHRGEGLLTVNLYLNQKYYDKSNGVLLKNCMRIGVKSQDL